VRARELANGVGLLLLLGLMVLVFWNDISRYLPRHGDGPESPTSVQR